MGLHSRISLFAAIVALLLNSFPAAVRGEGKTQAPASEPPLWLEELERMALLDNPTLAQASAAVRAAEGRKLQAGLYPNPILGYLGGELSLRSPSRTSEHLLFIEQAIVTAGKLKKSRRIFQQEQALAEALAEAQKQRVLNMVRLLYYEALGAQQLVELRGELARIAREAASISEELFNVGQADRPDLLEAEIEAERAELDLSSAVNDQERIWQILAAVVGNPSLKPTRLAGSLEGEIPTFDQEMVLAALLRDSPEIKSAQAEVERARAALERARAEPVPDIRLRGGLGYNFAQFENLARPVGLEAFIEVGVPLPIFNRNQGNIRSAQAEVERAEQEVRRLELSLRARFASAFRSYLNSLAMVERYRKQILPRAQKAYDLYLTSFRQMAAAYPQVLIAQRTLFQARAEYISALVDLWQRATLIRGFLLAGGLDALPPELEVERGAMPAGQGAGNEAHGR